MKKIWDYFIPSDKHGNWGKFIIDSTGYFSCVTDYGNYAFQWTAHGDDDFREFLVSLNTDYLLGKLSSGKTVFDERGTRQIIKERIVSMRKDGKYGLDATEARYLYDKVDDCSTEHDFEEFFREAKDPDGDDFFRDWWEMFSQCYDYDLQGFAERLWPRFVEALKAELLVTERVCKEPRVIS